MTMNGATLVAIFDDRLEAERAVRDLEVAGFNDENIGYAIRGKEAVAGGMITDTSGTKDGKGATPVAADILARHGGYHMHQMRQSPVETRGIFSEP